MPDMQVQHGSHSANSLRAGHQAVPRAFEWSVLPEVAPGPGPCADRCVETTEQAADRLTSFSSLPLHTAIPEACWAPKPHTTGLQALTNVALAKQTARLRTAVADVLQQA